MKFFHAADIHLDSPLEGLERYEGAPVELIRGATRRALENLVMLALRERVDFVVIAGDLYDGDWRDFNTGMFFIQQMNKLCEAGIRLYLIAGNHDAANNMTRKLRLPVNPDGDGVMLSHEQAETRRLQDLGVAIHGRSFANQAEKQNMVPDYPIPIANWFNLGILHTSLIGADDGHDTYATCSQTDLRSKGYDYWALGHIHKRSLLPDEGSPLILPPIFYSGNIQGRHIREPGARGCFLVTVDQRQQTKIEFRPLDVFRWEVCVVSCVGCSTSDDILERFRVALRSLMTKHDSLPLGIRVRLEGPTATHQRLTSQRSAMTAEIRSIATVVSDGLAWVEQVRIATHEPVEKVAPEVGEGPLAELERYFDEIPINDQAISQLTDELKDLAKKLPAELMLPPDGLQLDNPDWIREIVRELKPMLMDRFHG